MWLREKVSNKLQRPTNHGGSAARETREMVNDEDCTSGSHHSLISWCAQREKRTKKEMPYSGYSKKQINRENRKNRRKINRKNQRKINRKNQTEIKKPIKLIFKTINSNRSVRFWF